MSRPNSKKHSGNKIEIKIELTYAFSNRIPVWEPGRSDKRTNPISVEELSKQVKEKGLDRYEKVLVVGGKKYVSMVRKLFSKKKIYTPLEGYKGIGYMMNRLNQALPVCLQAGRQNSTW